jgi:hypothetical protein
MNQLLFVDLCMCKQRWGQHLPLRDNFWERINTVYWCLYSTHGSNKRQEMDRQPTLQGVLPHNGGSFKGFITKQCLLEVLYLSNVSYGDFDSPLVHT